VADIYILSWQQEASPKIILAIEHFQPILETLADLDRDDPKLAFQVARHVGLYRRLWASCVPKHLDGEISDRNDRTSKEATNKLSKERDGPQLRSDEHLTRLYSFEKAFDQTQERLISILRDWNQCPKSDLALLMDIKGRV
jgi:hypothetical protein